MQVVQCLTELGLSVKQARISSDGGWFVDGVQDRSEPHSKTVCTVPSKNLLWHSADNLRYRSIGFFVPEYRLPTLVVATLSACLEGDHSFAVHCFLSLQSFMCQRPPAVESQTPKSWMQSRVCCPYQMKEVSI